MNERPISPIIAGLPTSLAELELGGRVWRLLRPTSSSDLLDRAEYQQDDRAPYWAELWPAGLTLASWLAGDDSPLARRAARPLRVLEIGCGLGLASLVAATLGHDVTAADYQPEPLEFLRASALLAGRTRVVGPDAADTAPANAPAHASANASHDAVAGERVAHRLTLRQFDWRTTPSWLTGFELVVAADVLYEVSAAEPVARCLARALAPQGEAILFDPQRATAAEFLDQASRCGLEVDKLPPLALPRQKGLAIGRPGQQIDRLRVRSAC